MPDTDTVVVPLRSKQDKETFLNIENKCLFINQHPLLSDYNAQNISLTTDYPIIVSLSNIDKTVSEALPTNKENKYLNTDLQRYIDDINDAVNYFVNTNAHLKDIDLTKQKVRISKSNTHFIFYKHGDTFYYNTRYEWLIKLGTR